MNEYILSLINRREKQLLVHSFLYYQQMESIISDQTFDQWSRELVKLMEQYPEEFKQSVHYKDFITFDGTTGYYLPFATPDIHNKGLQLLNYHKEYSKRQG